MIYKKSRKTIFLLQAILFLSIYGIAPVQAQEPPPRPIRIYLTQDLNFGAFSQGPAGGTITIDPTGTRSSTGDVIPLSLGYLYFPAIFEVHAHPGTVISLLSWPSAILTGTPSGSMSLQIDSSNPSFPFVSTVHFNIAIPLYIGATLTVGSPAANPPGSYTGTFEITLVRE